MQPPFARGDLIQVRGQAWRIQALTQHEDCLELDLESPTGHAPSAPDRLTLLSPFDRPTRMAARSEARVLSRRAWMHALRERALADSDGSPLQAPVRARIDLLPHQLEPALAAVLLDRRRLLLADAVGLGKTIEAGLVLAELRSRKDLERTLILTPAGLRDQWADELRQRFGLESVVADAAWLRAMRAEWPLFLNPWSVPGVFITSIDFAKQPGVRRSLEDVTWDALVVDEAHLASHDSDRHGVAHACATRARRVLLLTATPHAGDDAAFRTLCRIGSLGADDAIGLVRRSRAEVGLPGSRRVSLLRVRSSPAEATARRMLRDYARSVWARRSDGHSHDARLAMVVLIKRSLSGMAPLLRSLEMRLARLGQFDRPEARQLPLPWDDDEDTADLPPAHVMGAPGLDDPAQERACLQALILAARRALASDSKPRVLYRILRRIGESVIVFTEYRDTLAALEAGLSSVEPIGVLHGGLDRAARAAVLRRFTSGDARILLATDAAGEGLNLQQRCRTVINLELPWNPMRLEQRIGRVDRIGQTAVVHAISLLARGTAESSVVARLVRRLDRADAAVGSVTRVINPTDEAITEQWLGLEIDRQDTPAVGSPGASAPSVDRLDLRGAAIAAASQLEWRRALWHARVRDERRTRSEPAHARAGLSISAVRRHRLPAPLNAGGVLAIVCGGGCTVALFLKGATPRLRRRAELRDAARSLLTACRPAIVRAALASVASRPAPLMPERDGSLRDRRLAGRLDVSAEPAQAGLFDRRVQRAAADTSGRHSRRPHWPGEDGPGALLDRNVDVVLLLFATP